MPSKEEQHEDTYDADVVIVGAGFAGATVARECALRGLRTLVLEGRDRVGGRTHTVQMSNGDIADIGGTFIHWTQPHFWSEITRYGLTGDVVDAAEVETEWVLAPIGEGLEWRSAEEHYEREKALVERFFESASSVFPRPYDPLACADAVAELDSLTVRDRLDELNLSPEDDAHLSALLSTFASSTPEKISYVNLLRWAGLTGQTYDAMLGTLMGSKLKHGTGPLLDAILADGGATVRLSSRVEKVATVDDHVELTLTGGEVVSGAVVVIATPSGVWPHLQFSPPLSPERLDAARTGMQTPTASKSIAVIKGEPRSFFIQPRLGHPIALMWTTHQRPNGEQVVTLMNSAAMKDANDPQEVGAAIRELLPDAELVDVRGSNFDDRDEFAQGGWPILAPGLLTRYAPHERLSKPEGRVVYATADIATTWNSFIDGAIESGLRAARDVQGILR
ncbi:flavin monoamine oxidase family protein [Rhodococcus sp. NPDC057014]|uniref:flavin monoamine oxidase family protein n=1 Tax=Rhodococcus sp. NPDC057014 TaxID=3346000 RepID=UPI003643165F